MEKGIVLPVFYLGSIDYFSKIKDCESVIYLEQFEHYPKQTYRNRTSIYSPNGKLDLTIPVKKGANNHTLLKDVRISYDADWQRLHWRTLQTSYRRSSFFEFYEDDFVPFFEKRSEFLFDFNIGLFELCLKLLKLKSNIEFTTEYIKFPTNLTDLRAADLSSQSISEPFTSYYQIFEEKHNFIPNLSIVDLLFNQGPQSKQYL